MVFGAARNGSILVAVGVGRPSVAASSVVDSVASAGGRRAAVVADLCLFGAQGKLISGPFLAAGK